MPSVGSLPLPTLLSQVLVAFIIEFDNEFEHRSPHRTTRHGSTGESRQEPWLASMVMWSSCMQFLDEDGLPARELEKRARTKTNLNGIVRWGYVTAGAHGVIRPTPKGTEAQKIWRPLFGEIEKRWEDRFGRQQIDDLRLALRQIVQRLEVALPECLPILGYGLFSRASGQPGTSSGTTLPALLSQVLLAFAMEFERESPLSLAICADLLRILDESGVPVRDLPVRSGVSKEALHMAMGILEKGAWTVVESGPAGTRTRIARLTVKGREAQDAYRRLLARIEQRWAERFGEENLGRLRATLGPLVGDGGPESPLFACLEPYPEGWRASIRKLRLLPHYPMVLHRGGFPDGS